MALLTAIATGFGVIPFFFRKSFSAHILGMANAFAGGLMLAAALLMFWEGYQVDGGYLFMGLLIGAVFTGLSSYFLAGKASIKMGALEGITARKALLIVGIMTVHSAAEGIGIGVSFGDGAPLGTFISLAMMVHNIPEGLAIGLVLIPAGISVWRAAGWSVFSSLPQPILAVPAFWFVATFRPLLPIGLGFAAGAMVWMVVKELLPEALQAASKPQVLFAFLVGLGSMLGFEYWLT